MTFWTYSPSAICIAVFLVGAGVAEGKSSAIQTFCGLYPTSPHCSGQQINCTFCHTTPPDQNSFGSCVKKAMPATGNFDQDLVTALSAAEKLDCDGDGAANLLEISMGTFPGNASSKPKAPVVDEVCDAKKLGSDWNVCGYDPVFAYKRVHQDFCGSTPEYDDVENFRALSSSAQLDKLDSTMESCIQTEFWIGKDGVLWNVGHKKIQPLRTIKSGENGGTIQLGDYDDDYNLFVYHQMNGRDVRGILTADYFVERADAPTTYTPVNDVPMHPDAGGIVRLVSPVFDNTQQFVPKAQRAGMLTTLWNAVSKTMFTSIPRTNAAGAMRAFLNLDIAKGEGLSILPPSTYVLVDHDNKGVTQPECAFCHQVLDAATYPFLTFNGLSFRDQGTGVDIGDIFSPDSTTTIPVPRIARRLIDSPTSKILVPGIYKPNRHEILAEIKSDTEPGLANTPTSGYLLGQPVADIKAWARVAANSDEFAKTTVSDYWHFLIGEQKSKTNDAEFTKLWQDLKSTDAYSVNAMLRKLIRTEAYGAP